MIRILVLTKRQYMHKDLIDDRFGRFREIPLALSRRGNRVRGLCLSYKHKSEDVFDDGPVLWKSINAGSLKLYGLFRFIFEAQKLAKTVDAIWACSDSFYGVIGLNLARQYRIPLIFDLYDNFEYYLTAKLPVVKQLYKKAVVKADVVTCVSEPLKGLVRSYGRANNIVVLSNAVQSSTFRPMDKDRCRKSLDLPVNSKIIGTAGALESSRGIETLFSAFDLLEGEHPDLHMVLAGPRNISIPHHERIHDLGVLPLEDVPTLLNALDVAIICNRDNKFGRYCYPQKAVEAMACNIPIVAAHVGSMAEIFKDNPEWLYDPNDVAALARAVNRRLTDPTTGYVSPPTWNDMAEILEARLHRILAESASSRSI